MSSRLVSRRTNPMQSALRAWTLGPLPEGAAGERWSLPDEIAPPAEGGFVRRRGRLGSYGLLIALLAVLGVAVARNDPFSRGWRDPTPAVTHALERRMEGIVAALAEALGPSGQSPRGSSSGR